MNGNKEVKKKKKFIPKDRCLSCATIRVNKQCKNPLCSQYVPDKPKRKKPHTDNKQTEVHAKP